MFLPNAETAIITVTKTPNGGNEVFDFTTTSTDINLDGNFTGNTGFVIDTSTNNAIAFTGLSPAVTYTITELAEPGWEFDSLSCIGGTTVTDITGTTGCYGENEVLYQGINYLR